MTDEEPERLRLNRELSELGLEIALIQLRREVRNARSQLETMRQAETQLALGRSAR